jgi:hypothetical protein
MLPIRLQSDSLIFVPLTVPLKIRLTRISTYLDGPRRLVSCSKYWLAGL